MGEEVSSKDIVHMIYVHIEFMYIYAYHNKIFKDLIKCSMMPLYADVGCFDWAVQRIAQLAGIIF